MSSLLLFFLLVSIVLGADQVSDKTDTPACDPKVVGEEALKKYFPSGPPRNLAQTIKENGPYSYVVLSETNAKVSELSLDAECVSVTMTGVNAATLGEKFYLNKYLNEMTKDYTVTEKDYYLEYQNKDEKQLYRIYFLFNKNNVFITYKCCEKCSGTTLNVGVAVSDKARDASSTKATIAEAKGKLQDYKLDANIKILPSCPDVKNNQ